MALLFNRVDGPAEATSRYVTDSQAVYLNGGISASQATDASRSHHQAPAWLSNPGACLGSTVHSGQSLRLRVIGAWLHTHAAAIYNPSWARAAPPTGTCVSRSRRQALLRHVADPARSDGHGSRACADSRRRRHQPARLQLVIDVPAAAQQSRVFKIHQNG